MWSHLRFFGTHLLVAIAAAGLLAGGAFMWSGLLAGVLLWIGADAVSGPAHHPPRYAHPLLLDAALYSLFPSLVALFLVFLWSIAPDDSLGLGAIVERSTGIDVLARRAASDWLDYSGAAASFALAVALAGILTAHELFHRTDDPLAMFTSRWMLAIACNSTLEVAHVYGHHQDVGTDADVSTARRGENVYAFFVRSTLGQIGQAWGIECRRLATQGRSRFGVHNKVIRGFVRSYAVLGLVFTVGGVAGLAVFLSAVFWNKLILEALNYLEHYGLVRVPGQPFETRHAWNSDREVSHAVLFHLPFHAEHHFEPRLPYYRLERDARAPILPWGYLASLALTFVPPLWRRIVDPALRQWDAARASSDELRILGEA
ncbi:MAG: fatty acid desaturase [Gammaproteobacteria bacterium]|nr:fatty acid desaturase [Gammaproteobacteria bacterium]